MEWSLNPREIVNPAGKNDSNSKRSPSSRTVIYIECSQNRSYDYCHYY